MLLVLSDEPRCFFFMLRIMRSNFFFFFFLLADVPWWLAWNFVRNKNDPWFLITTCNLQNSSTTWNILQCYYHLYLQCMSASTKGTKYYVWMEGVEQGVIQSSYWKQSAVEIVATILGSFLCPTTTICVSSIWLQTSALSRAAMQP